MGVGELNYAYEDYGLTDTIFLVGANPLETQTNLFLNHMVPGIRKGAKVIIVDPRRTVTVNACEIEAGKDNVLQLQIKSGSDLALFNTLFTYIVDQGWIDKDFIANSTFQGDIAQPLDEAHPAALGSLEAALKECRTNLKDGAEICGLSEADIVKAAEWIAKPKEDGSRRKCVTAYEKGIIWGNDNYRTIGALVNIALATGNVGREGGGVCRLGGHQEGYMRPSDAHVGRPAPYIDQLLIAGRGKVHHIWANDHYKTTLNASIFKREYNRRTNMVKEAMDARAGATREELVDAIVAAIEAGGLFSVNVDIIHTQIGQSAHVILPAVESGEMNLTSMNGERRMRLVEKYMDGPGSSKPDSTGRPKKTPSWMATTLIPARSSLMIVCGPWATMASRSRSLTSRTANWSGRSVSMPTANSTDMVARMERLCSVRAPGADCRRQARLRNATTMPSSSITAAPTSTGRTGSSTRTMILSATDLPSLIFRSILKTWRS
jgi:arsenite oxidase large subunit